MLKKLCIALISSLFSILSIDSNETLAQCSVTLGNNFSVCNGQEITLDAQVTGGTGNYSYSWSNSSDTGPSRTFIPTGDQTQNVSQTYSVTVTDPGGCFATASVTVNVMSTPSASMVVTDNSCTIIGGVEFSFPNHPNRSAIEFSVNGGGSYLASIPDNSGSVFYMLNPGTYHAFSRWGNNQCPADLGTFTIADDGTGISLDIGPNFTICDGQPVTITPIVTGGTGALTYSWSATDGSESGTGLTFTPTGSSTANINKFYDVKVIDENGCTAEDQVRITLESSPSATTILTQSSCNSIGGIEFTFPDHSSRTGIEFSTSGNSNYYSNVPDNSGSIFYALAPGDYHAYARWGNNECPVDLGEFTITDDGSSITLDAGPDIISCHGEEITLNTTITGGTGPYNYTWESTDGLDSGTGSTFTPLGSATQNLIKDYNIHITDDNGCVASDQIRIRIFSAPSASFTVSGNSCNTLGGIEFSFANHPNRTNIRFSVNGDTNYFPSILDNSGSIFYNLTPGSYHAFVKWGGGSTCPVDLGEFTVLDDGTAVYLDAGPDISVCNGDSFTISPTVTGGTLPHSYSWSSTDGLESGTGLTITPLGSPTQNLNRTYTITITDANGCINVDEISVGILSFPNVTNITTEAGCGTDAQVSLEFENHQNRSALEFSFNNGSSYLSQVLDNSGSITYNMAPGTFPTFVRWGNNQCPLSLGNITLESKEISLQMGGDVTICNEDEINFSPTVSDATEPYSYAWTNGSDSGTGLTLTPQGTNNSNSAYSYTFTVTDAEGCTDSDNLEVSILSNPTATVFSSAADCDGDAEVLFEFPDHPNFAGIAFSLDGGVTYESPLLDNSGSVSYSRPEGVYSTYIQWYDGTCPVEIGEAEIAGGSVFLSAASGNASDAIWTIPGSSNLFSIDFCEDRSLVITDGTSVMADLDIEAENITVENTGSLDMSANNHILGIYGDFTNNGDFQAQQGRVRLIGSQPQNIAGDFVKFHDVEILNIFNVSLQTTMQTNGTIYPNLGIFDINGNKLTLVSEPVGSEILTGSIAEIGPFSDVVGEIELERYVSSLEDGFRYMGIPIQGQTVADFEGDFVTTGFTGSDYPNHWYTNVKYIDETDRVAGDTDSGYKDVNSTTDLIDSSKGYIGYFPPSTTANLLNADGPFNKGDMSFNLSYTDLGTPSEDGWHLIPNPYPSAIDIMSPDITFNNVDRAIYIIDHELGSDWKGEYVVYNNGVSINGATNIVASYQAFLVKANGPGASITFRESSKSNEQGIFYRNQTEQRSLLRFSLNQDDHKYETVVAFHEDATEGFDPNFDAYRRESVKFALGTVSNGDTLCINTLESYEEMLEIPVEIFTASEGVFTFSLDDIQHIENPLCLVVKDLITGEEHAMVEGDNFVFSSEEGYAGVRFMISSSPVAVVEVENPSCNTSLDGLVNVHPTLSDIYSFILSDSDENVIEEVISEPTARFEGLAPGVYNLNLESENHACANSDFPILVAQPEVLSEPSISYLRDECKMNQGKIYVSANHNSELHVQVFLNNSLVQEDYGYELLELEGLGSEEYQVEVFDQCGSFEFSVDLTPIEELTADFSIPSELVILDDLVSLDLISDSENASQDSWLIDGIWYCSGSFCYVEFSDAGTHEITLISRNGNCEEIATKTIQVINLTTEIKEIDNSQFSINLNEQFIEVTSNSNEVEFDTIELFDVNGKLLGNWDSKGQDFYRINHSNFPSGVYLIRISAGTILLQMDKIVK